jgi:Flp pilus assembly protein CpaB
MRASTLFGLTIAILIGMAVVFGVKSAGLFDKKVPEKVVQDRPKVLVPRYNLFEGLTVSRVDEVMVRNVEDHEMDQFIRNRHKYMTPMPEAAIFRVLARNVGSNEPLLKDYFQDIALPDSLSVLLGPGMKAVNLEMRRDRAGGGVLRKNDMVDVFLNTTITDHYGNSTTASALIAPDLRVVVKRNSIWNMLARDDENKPIPFTLEANAYRAALIEFAKGKGELILVPTGPNSSKKKVGVMALGDLDKEEEQRILAVNQGKSITDRDLEEIFKLTPPPPVAASKAGPPTMIERWSGVVPRGGHFWPSHEYSGAGPMQQPMGPVNPNSWVHSDGKGSSGYRFGSHVAAAQKGWVPCSTCQGGKKWVD